MCEKVNAPYATGLTICNLFDFLVKLCANVSWFCVYFNHLPFGVYFEPSLLTLILILSELVGLLTLIY